MPSTRNADYYIGCLNGSVFIDFDEQDLGKIVVKRISFDGYGCCNLNDLATSLNESDSKLFKNMMKTRSINQVKLTKIIKNTVFNNKHLIWEDALKEYGFM